MTTYKFSFVLIKDLKGHLKMTITLSDDENDQNLRFSPNQYVETSKTSIKVSKQNSNLLICIHLRQLLYKFSACFKKSDLN